MLINTEKKYRLESEINSQKKHISLLHNQLDVFNNKFFISENFNRITRTIKDDKLVKTKLISSDDCEYSWEYEYDNHNRISVQKYFVDVLYYTDFICDIRRKCDKPRRLIATDNYSYDNHNNIEMIVTIREELPNITTIRKNQYNQNNKLNRYEQINTLEDGSPGGGEDGIFFFDYGSSGLCNEMRLPSGRIKRFAYDPKGNCISETITGNRNELFSKQITIYNDDNQPSAIISEERINGIEIEVSLISNIIVT